MAGSADVARGCRVSRRTTSSWRGPYCRSRESPTPGWGFTPYVDINIIRKFAQHTQQAVEKAIEAVLAAQDVEFPFTHDLNG
jgi:hypothetical protein